MAKSLERWRWKDDGVCAPALAGMTRHGTTNSVAEFCTVILTRPTRFWPSTSDPKSLRLQPDERPSSQVPAGGIYYIAKGGAVACLGTSPRAPARRSAGWPGGERGSPSQKHRQEPPSKASHAAALRAHGLELGYNLDHDDALAAFKAAIAGRSDHPAAIACCRHEWIKLLFQQGAITVDDYLGQARADLRARRRSRRSTALSRRIFSALGRSAKRGSANIRTTPTRTYQVGAAYGFLASYTATVEGRVLGSLGPARRAYREHERVARARSPRARTPASSSGCIATRSPAVRRRFVCLRISPGSAATASAACAWSKRPRVIRATCSRTRCSR